MHPPTNVDFWGFFIFEGDRSMDGLTDRLTWKAEIFVTLCVFCEFDLSLLCSSTYYYYSSIMLECHLRGGGVGWGGVGGPCN